MIDEPETDPDFTGPESIEPESIGPESTGPKSAGPNSAGPKFTGPNSTGAAIDPRYDPVFQRGYDPAKHGHLAAERRQSEPRPLTGLVAPGSPAADPLASDTLAPDHRTHRDDEGADEEFAADTPDDNWAFSDRDDTEYVPQAPNRYVIALWIYGAALIVGVFAVYWYSSRMTDDSLPITRSPLYGLVATLGAPILTAGILAVAGASFLTAVRYRTDGDHRDDTLHDGRRAVTTLRVLTGHPALWVLLILGVLLVASGVQLRVSALVMSTANTSGDEGVFRDIIFMAVVLSPALLPAGMITLLALVIVGAVGWRRSPAFRGNLAEVALAQPATDTRTGATEDPHIGQLPTKSPRSGSPRRAANPFVGALWAISAFCAAAGILAVLTAYSSIYEITGATSWAPAEARIVGVLSDISPAIVEISLLTIAGLLLFHAVTWRAHLTLTMSDRGSARS